MDIVDKNGKSRDIETSLAVYSDHPKLEEYRNRAVQEVRLTTNADGTVVSVDLCSLGSVPLKTVKVCSRTEGEDEQILAWVREYDGKIISVAGARETFCNAPSSRQPHSSPYPVAESQGTSLTLGMPNDAPSTAPFVTARATPSPYASGATSTPFPRTREPQRSSESLSTAPAVELQAAAAVVGVPSYDSLAEGASNLAVDAVDAIEDAPSTAPYSTGVAVPLAGESAGFSFTPFPGRREAAGSREPPSFPRPVVQEQAAAAVVGIPSSRYSPDGRGGPLAEGESHLGLHVLEYARSATPDVTEAASLSASSSETALESTACSSPGEAGQSHAKFDTAPTEGYRLRPGEVCEPRFRQDRMTPSPAEKAARQKKHQQESDDISEAMQVMLMANEERVKAAMKRTHERHIRKEEWLRAREKANAENKAEVPGPFQKRVRHWGELG